MELSWSQKRALGALNQLSCAQELLYDDGTQENGLWRAGTF